MKKKPLVVLTGPTAVGKSQLSIALAKAMNGEIISADSMQVYRYMNIGSAKITKEEMQGVPHYLIDEINPEEEFHVMEFQRRSLLYMKEIYEKGKIPILVGGTGFYIQAILKDISFTEEKGDKEYRKELEAFSKKENGIALLHEKLHQVDEQSARDIHPNNVKRVIRALEYYHVTGKQISVHNNEEKEKESPYQYAYFVLNDDRSYLYQKIDQRIDLMIEKGLLKEVEELKARGYTKDMVSMQGLGYKEFLAYLEGVYTFEEAVTILKRDTRHFAKRQLTWFRRENDVIWLNKEEYQRKEEDILEKMMEILREKRIVS